MVRITLRNSDFNSAEGHMSFFLAMITGLAMIAMLYCKPEILSAFSSWHLSVSPLVCRPSFLASLFPVFSRHCLETTIWWRCHCHSNHSRWYRQSCGRGSHCRCTQCSSMWALMSSRPSQRGMPAATHTVLLLNQTIQIALMAGYHEGMPDQCKLQAWRSGRWCLPLAARWLSTSWLYLVSGGLVALTDQLVGLLNVHRVQNSRFQSTAPLEPS